MTTVPQGQGPIQDLLDSLSAEELGSCGGSLRHNHHFGHRHHYHHHHHHHHITITILTILRTNPNVEELGSMGQYSAPHQGSSFSEGSPYERGKDNSTASSSRWETPTSPNTHSLRTLLASHGTLENYANTFYHEAARLKNLDQWLTSNDEVDYLPSTPPSLLTSSEENMSGGEESTKT